MLILGTVAEQTEYFKNGSSRQEVEQQNQAALNQSVSSASSSSSSSGTPNRFAGGTQFVPPSNAPPVPAMPKSAMKQSKTAKPKELLDYAEYYTQPQVQPVDNTLNFLESYSNTNTSGPTPQSQPKSLPRTPESRRQSEGRR